MKREKGITTIGLVVTIIVMRILAEVTILNTVWEGTKWFNRNKCRRISEEKTVQLNAKVNPVNAIYKNK